MARIKNANKLRIYSDCMVEIKDRIFEIDGHLSMWRNENVSSQKTCEETALQLRKIYELIGFASMTADLERYREVKPNFKKDWRFREILSRVSCINSNFLPKPCHRVRSTEPGVDWHFESRPDAILTQEELVFRHGYLNNFLHAKNPFAGEVDYSDACRKLDTWVREVASLLSQHQYVVGPNQVGFIVELNNHGADVTALEVNLRI